LCGEVDGTLGGFRGGVLFVIAGKSSFFFSKVYMINFGSLGLRNSLCLNLANNFKVYLPSKEQQKLVPLYLSGQNVLLKDVTGSGKSFGFVLAMLSKRVLSLGGTTRAEKKKGIESLYIVPSRELALQVKHWTSLLSDNDITKIAISGEDATKQDKYISDQNPKHLIATPNRIKSLISQNIITASSLNMVIIDELEKYQPEFIDTIMEFSNHKGQNIQFLTGSASINNKLVKKLENEIEFNIIDFQTETKVPSNINHSAYYISDNKPIKLNPLVSTENITLALPDDHDLVIDMIVKLMSSYRQSKAFVFTSSSISLRSLVDRLKDRGLKADKLINLQSYHDGTLPFEEFYNGKVDVICASEFEARGLDIPEISLVFMLGPLSPASYLHCSGRVGRFGKSGVAISLFGGERYSKKYCDMLDILSISALSDDHDYIS
jgi:superfamily II DNA/RNA helicase